MSEPDFLLKRGDDSSAISAILQDANGDPVDIQGAQQIKWRMASISGGTLVVNDDAANGQVGDGSDGTLGLVSYGWGTVPSSAGFYLGEWEVTYSQGSVQTFPNGGYVSVYVMEDLR